MFLLSMPGVRRAGHLTVKVVTVFEDNFDAGLPSHLATINLYDPDTGACLAFMDATYITAIRTSASAAVSTRLLAREDARVLTVLGAGVQG
jgi:alanine dehydrogenase